MFSHQQKSALTVALLASVAATVGAAPVSDVERFFSSNGRVVTEASYPTDETSRQILKVQSQVGVNEFLHNRKLTPTNDQPVVRMNRDTYYSRAVVDVSGGASITLPDLPEGKYMSVQPVTEDHRIQPMSYGSGTYELATHSGNHVILIIRLDATLTEAEAAELQNQMQISAKNSNLFTAEPVQRETFEVVEDELKAKMPVLIKRDGPLALRGGFTAPTDESRDFYDQDKYQVLAAVGWGGAQWKDNIYELSGSFPSDLCHQATFEDPGNSAFWSITVYDKAGFMFNDLANVSSDTAKPNDDGTYTVSFGCDRGATNNLPTGNDSGEFTLGIRHYQPSERVREGGYRLLPFVKRT